MFETMKLGTKIASGYAGVLIITSVVTAFTLVEVSQQTTAANELAAQVAPTVQIANDVERYSLATVKEMTAYEAWGAAENFDASLKNLERVEAALTQALDHYRKYPSLTAFGAAAEKVHSLVKDYRALAETTKVNTLELVAARAGMNKAAGEFFAGAEEFRRVRPDALDIHRAMLLGTEVRLNAWKAQANRDVKGMDDALVRLADLDRDLEKMKANNRSEDLQQHLEEMRVGAKAYGAQIKLVQASMIEASELAKQRAVIASQVIEGAKAVSVAGIETTMRQSNAVADSLSSVRLVVAVGLLLAVLFGVVIAVFVTRSITGPINRIIGGLSASGEQVASASSQVSSSSQQLANGASQQASNLEEVSSSLEEVTSMTRQNADNARKANGTAKEASEAANRGASSMERMNDAMQKIRSSASETAKIVKTIDEIAFQTNLLALNAAVEAARAGEAGKGFAVVAEEVRNLAQRSAEAAKTTASLIEDSQRNAESGAAVSEQVNGILREIVNSATQVTTLVADVATASEQQTSGITQINTAVSQMDRITQSNAANAEESASASEELSAQAVELNEMVEQLGRLVNGAGAIHAAHQARKPAHAAHKPVAALPPKAKLSAVKSPPAPRRSAPPAPSPAPSHGFEPLQSAPIDPKDLIPLDDSELKQF